MAGDHLPAPGDDFVHPDPATDPALATPPDRQAAGGRRTDPDLQAAVDALPGLARIAAATWWHTTEWGVRTSLRAGRRVARAATDREEAAALAHDVTDTAHAVAELARAVSAGVPVPRALADLGSELADEPVGEPRPAVRPVTHPLTGVLDPASYDVPGAGQPGGGSNGSRPHSPVGHRGGASGVRADPAADLRKRGAQLLERSRDVWDTSTGHPAYGRILDELAPDEARILLLLLEGGPQPSVDVRTGGPIGMVSSQLIAPGLTMIGARAGCRHVDQVPAFLNNLFRLGLVWFSRESLRDPMDYQVLEAQPDVLAALHSVKFAKVVRRSIHLTPFGEDFCRSCLVDDAAAAVARFPEHGLPAGGDATQPPSPG